MRSPLLPLRAAIVSRCASDTPLAGLMGGTAAIHDEPPRGAPPLYALFGDVELRDLSTSSGSGHEQDLSILIWAKPGSAATAIAVADRLLELLDGAPLALSGQRLVSLSMTGLDARRDAETNLARVALRLRAVTEATA